MKIITKIIEIDIDTPVWRPIAFRLSGINNWLIEDPFNEMSRQFGNYIRTVLD